jgi:hypothetical protein
VSTNINQNKLGIIESNSTIDDYQTDNSSIKGIVSKDEDVS